MDTPTVFKRQAIRAAIRIHQHLVEPTRDTQGGNLPHSAWDGLCQLVQRLPCVDRKGWRAASQSLQLDVDYAIGRLESQLEAIRQRARSSSIALQVASAGELVADLFALAKEFEEVSLDLSRKSASVLTSP